VQRTTDNVRKKEHRLEYEGSFKLVRKIAEGGMATVYEAEQLGPAGFSKRIALKVIHPRFARRKEFLQLFIDEAKLSANLAHGNIVQIFQLGEIDGDYFITMEFIQGPTLRALIDRHRELATPIPPALAAYIASRVCRALDFAHHVMDATGQRLDIVHRDVSPGNVMITWDGHIKLADFGIAKAATSIDPAEDGQWLMGKKHYASPEQILGLEVGPSSDVFSLGVVLFELLALKQLFHEERTALMIEEVAVKPLPDPRTLIRDLDSELEQILLMALERDPERRSTAAAMGQALDGWIAAQQQLASPDQLQAHLANVFPASYMPRTAATERTSFTAPLGSSGRRRRSSGLRRFFRG
jgi:serine/threonine protein kinase